MIVKKDDKSSVWEKESKSKYFVKWRGDEYVEDERYGIFVILFYKREIKENVVDMFIIGREGRG